MSELLRGRGSHQALPDTAGSLLAAAPGSSRRSTASTSRSTRARRSGWSASPGAASRRPAACIMRLIEPTSGSVTFDGRDVLALKGRTSRPIAADVQIIFQDPYASLNPRMTIGEIVAEPLVIHSVGTRREQNKRVKELLDIVGLNPEHTNRYPHEFSGGQRQRIGIARALALNPQLIVATSPSRRSTSRSRHRCSTCSTSSRTSSTSPTSSSRTTCRSFSTSPIASRSCTSARSSRSPTGSSSTRSRATPTRSRCSRRCPCRIPKVQRDASADPAPGRPAEPDRPADRLPVPHSLPDRAVPDVLDRRSRAARDRAGPLCGVSLRDAVPDPDRERHRSSTRRLSRRFSAMRPLPSGSAGSEG